MTVKCPYCQGDAQLVHGKVVYPYRPDLFDKKFWYCKRDQAWVGCHQRSKRHQFNGDEPKGRLANAELRSCRIAAHALFDPLWKSKTMTRSEAYSWLAGAIGMSLANMHIGMLDVDGCKAVIAACKARQQMEIA